MSQISLLEKNYFMLNKIAPYSNSPKHLSLLDQVYQGDKYQSFSHPTTWASLDL